MQLSKIVDLSISISTKTPSRASLETILVLCYHNKFSDRVREYSDADEMLTDGFTTDDLAYKVVSLIKSQNPCPKTVKLGRRATALTQIMRITPSITTSGFVYKGSINNEEFADVTVQPGDLVADVCDDLVVAIGPLSGTTIADDTTHVTVTTTAAGDYIAYNLGWSKNNGMALKDMTVDTTTDDELAAIQLADSDWYGLIVADSQSEATHALAAAFAEANDKLYIGQSPDTDATIAATTTDVMSDLHGLSYDQSAVIHTPFTGEYLAAGWLACQLVQTPGSYNAAFQTVKGCTAAALTTSEENSIEGKKGNHYTVGGGLSVTYPGTTASGGFLDNTRFIDWLHVNMQADIFALLVSNPKIPYTAEGRQMLMNAVEGRLIKGVKNQGIVKGSIVIEAPTVAEQEAADKAGRFFAGIKWSAVLQGAVNRVGIKGSLSL
jgi:hypothetical protein